MSFNKSSSIDPLNFKTNLLNHNSNNIKDIFTGTLSDLELEWEKLHSLYGMSNHFANVLREQELPFWKIRKDNPQTLVEIGALELDNGKYHWTEAYFKEVFLANYAYVLTVVREKLEKNIAKYSIVSNSTQLKKLLGTELLKYTRKIQKTSYALAYHMDYFREIEGYDKVFGNKLDVMYSLNFENEKFIERTKKRFKPEVTPPLLLNPYGGFRIDYKFWIGVDLSSRMVKILSEQIGDNNPDRTEVQREFTTERKILLLERLNIFKELEEKYPGPGNKKSIADLIAKLISKSPQNVRTAIRELNDNNKPASVKNKANIDWVDKTLKSLE